MSQLKSIYILEESIYETFYPLGTTPRTAEAFASSDRSIRVVRENGRL